ncbi:MAG: Rho termination factor N-terminal domain-containing protein, partial [Myxococcaceae bacterium]
MRKARSSKEKPADLEVAPEASTESAPRRRAPRRRRDPDAPEGETDGVEAAEAQTPLRPVLTPISRPVRDDELNEVPEDPSAPPVMSERPSAAELASDNGAVVTAADGTPMQVLKLNDLKRMKITELAHMAQDFGVEGTQGLKKQDLIFALLSGIADKKFEVHAEGVMELQSDGFGFLRSADSDYQPSPDDIYVSPSQVRRFNLRPGDTVYGPIRQPREGERFFALQKVDKVNFVDPTSHEARERILFDNLTPLYPTRKLNLEFDGSEMTTRIIDLFT